MVSYQTFVKIAFDVAKGKDVQFDGIQDTGDFISQVGELWSSDKEKFKQMTEKQIENKMREVVQA